MLLFPAKTPYTVEINIDQVPLLTILQDEAIQRPRPSFGGTVCQRFDMRSQQ